jgi:integrase
MFLARPHSLSSAWPISATNLSKRNFKERLAAAGLGDMRFQDLRHSHATLLLTLGVNPKVIQERLGHEGVKTTLDFYAHVLPSSQQSAATLTGSALYQNTPSITPSITPSSGVVDEGKTKKP